MSDNTTLHAGNTAALQALRALCLGLTEADLRTPMPAGWTVASVLAHVAFWDLRATALFERWQITGFDESPFDTDPINDATRPLFNLLPPLAAVQAALEAGEAVNRALAALPDAFIDELKTLASETVSLDRSEHKLEHIAEIKQVLGR